MTHMNSTSTPYMDDAWVTVPPPGAAPEAESLADRIRRVEADLGDINTFYGISVSPTRFRRLRLFYADELESLLALDFDALDQQSRVDFILLRHFLQRRARRLEAEHHGLADVEPLLPFAGVVVSLCEAREAVEPVSPENAAQRLDDIKTMADRAAQDVRDGKVETTEANTVKVAKAIDELRAHLAEFFAFYASYNPSFDFWVTAPCKAADDALTQLVPLIHARLVGAGDVVGEPICRQGLLRELEAEVVAYSPEELVQLAVDQFRQCQRQMRQASRDLGYGDDWKRAMDDVKTRSVPPGQQPDYEARWKFYEQ